MDEKLAVHICCNPYGHTEDEQREAVEMITARVADFTDTLKIYEICRRDMIATGITGICYGGVEE